MNSLLGLMIDTETKRITLESWEILAAIIVTILPGAFLLLIKMLSGNKLNQRNK